MFHVRDQIVVHAPVDRLFRLSTQLAVVEKTLKMHPAKGRTTGSVEAGDTVLWKGWQLGLPQYHESLIRNFERNRSFQDRMIAGRFAFFEHDHSFADRGDGTTLLRDDVRFDLPFGPAGWLVGRTVLQPHVRSLVHRRFALLKRLAEGEGWREFLGESTETQAPDSAAAHLQPSAAVASMAHT